MANRTEFDPIDKGTLRPVEPAIQSVGDAFKPLHVLDRPTYIILPDDVYPTNPFSLFNLYYTIEIMDYIVNITNEYDRAVSKTPEGRARGIDWHPTNRQEMYIFLSIRIYMTLHVENEIKDYWNTLKMAPIHPITKYMPRARFEELHIRYRVGDDDTTTYTRVCHLILLLYLKLTLD